MTTLGNSARNKYTYMTNFLSFKRTFVKTSLPLPMSSVGPTSSSNLNDMISGIGLCSAIAIAQSAAAAAFILLPSCCGFPLQTANCPPTEQRKKRLKSVLF